MHTVTVAIPHGFQKPNRAFSTLRYIFLVQKAPKMQQEMASTENRRAVGTLPRTPLVS